MKQVILIVVSLLFASGVMPAMAQPTSEEDSISNWKIRKWNVDYGIMSSYWSQSGYNHEWSYSNVGVGVEMNIGKSEAWVLAASLRLLDRKTLNKSSGNPSTALGTMGYSNKAVLSFKYLATSIMAGYVNNGFSLYFGPYIANALSGKIKSKGSFTTPTGSTSHAESEQDLFKTSKAKKFDVGLTTAIRYSFLEDMYMQLTVDEGLTKVMPGSSKTQWTSYAFSLGYCF